MQIILSTIWGTSLRKWITSICVTISAMAGTIVAVPPAWSALGLPEVASKNWAIKNIHDPIRMAQAQNQRQIIDLQLDIATGKLDQLDNNRASLEIEKLKTIDDQIKARADVQIRKIERDTGALTDQIKTLQGLRNTPPPP